MLKSLSCRFMALISALIWPLSALAQSSIGIGVAEQGAPATGFLAHIAIWQRQFNMLLSDALQHMQDKPSAAFWLIAVSFIYGILHAAGPGHGKAVISSYLIANDESLRRGIMLAFFSSILQALSAIVIIFAAYFLLPIRWTTSVEWLTTASFALVMLLGLWMLIKITPKLFKKQHAATTLFAKAESVMSDSVSNSTLGESALSPTQKGLNYQRNGHSFQGQGAVCDMCGDSHIADPALLNKKLNWKTALSVIFSVGLRPCSGAIFVLSFALLNDLILSGMLSVFAMAFGTFITVSILAIIAVKAKDIAFKIAGRHQTTGRFKLIIQWCAALFIFMMGVSLVMSSTMI